MENLCESAKGGAKPDLIKYTPTQDFIKHYFTPQCPVKGMLLWHSVGTGKTCSAIAAASSSFESQGYTILWVTRTTLKNDIWKNMFSQVCNEPIRQKIAKSQIESFPEDIKAQMKLLGPAWRIRPISYKQFSNLVSQQNDYYKRLVKENGEEDPLRKTLLIIDEAHKLYGGGDLSSIERPDMEALKTALLRSYAISGENSVRLLLMTATPITENPIEIVQLTNLCKPADQQIPATFDAFAQEYLDVEGHFTESGERRYLDAIAGHISYLNREKDARQFAQPIVRTIEVPLTPDSRRIDLYDKYAVKAQLMKGIQDAKAELDKNESKLEAELKDINMARFAHLEKICEDADLAISKKDCTRVVKSNIKELLNEAKEYIAQIKSHSKRLHREYKVLMD
jgi:superfamily II DNA or RNA helicase